MQETARSSAGLGADLKSGELHHPGPLDPVPVALRRSTFTGMRLKLFSFQAPGHFGDLQNLISLSQGLVP